MQTVMPALASRRVALAAALAAVVVAGCSTLAREPRVIAPVPGSIFDTREHAYVSTEVVQRAVREANFVLLGEIHDNLEHHRLQRELIGQMLAAGRRPALVMEQFDREFQAALDAERAQFGRTADQVMDAASFNRRGWQPEGYRPLVELALEHDLPILAANVSRTEARAIVRDPAKAAGLPPVAKDVDDAIAADIERSHCGQRPPPALLAGMVAAQRSRDVAMAAAMQSQAKRGAVLIAGGGHVRADRGAPLYMTERPLVIAFVEIDGERRSLKDYLDGHYASAKSFDFVWFTEKAARPDPCANMPALK